jgi:glycosyltransferase involved in cell wall biosynthesis
MRIAQMLDTLYWGGAQKMQLFLIESLRPLGIELTVISLRDSSDSPVVPQLQAAGARIVTFPFPSLFSPGSFLKLVNFLRAEKFDLLHAYLTYSNIIGPLAGALAGTPTIASLRNADFKRKSYSPQRVLLETLSMRHVATRVMANGIVVGELARQRVKNWRPVDIIPNAVDFVPAISQTEREQLRQELIGDSKRPLILSVGRLTQAKGFFDLLEAFAVVHAQYPAAALVIAGRGTLIDGLTARMQELGLTGSVFLLGMRNDVPRLLNAADFYVNSSHWEGTPVSVLEAMAAGLPIVATKVGESPYLLDEGAGLLVSPHQPQELAEALIALLASPEKCTQLGQIARERVRRYYSRETWRKSLLDLYAQITPKAKPYLAQVSTNSFQTSEA